MTPREQLLLATLLHERRARPPSCAAESAAIDAVEALLETADNPSDALSHLVATASVFMGALVRDRRLDPETTAAKLADLFHAALLEGARMAAARPPRLRLVARDGEASHG